MMSQFGKHWYSPDLALGRRAGRRDFVLACVSTMVKI